MKLGKTERFLIFFILGLVLIVTLPSIFAGLPAYLSSTEIDLIETLYCGFIIVFFMVAFW